MDRDSLCGQDSCVEEAFVVDQNSSGNKHSCAHFIEDLRSLVESERKNTCVEEEDTCVEKEDTCVKKKNPQWMKETKANSLSQSQS